MKQLFQKINIMKTLAFFFENPYSEAYLRELARKIDMDPATALRCIKILEEEKLITRRKEQHADYFKANLTPEFKALKIAYTLSKINDAGIVEKIKSETDGVSSILIYGSCARGEDSNESDVDVLVIAIKSKARAIDLSKLIGKEVNLQVHSISEWKKISKENRAFYLEVISNSIAIEGKKPVID